MGCATGGCSSGGCSTGGCNKLNTYDWLAEMELPPHMKPFDVVEVRFKGTRKEFYRNIHNLDITLGDYVVVDVENGYDIGKVSMKGELVKLQLKKNSLTEDKEFRKIIRRANETDINRYNEIQQLEVPTMYQARTIALQLGLKMKLSDVEYQGDKRKAIFYYTAEERVDFRELIKKLADAFKVRIEMKQIGYRQEAGRLGAIGSCGRELCCSTWLTDFKVVQTSAARYQNLSLNPLKLSGQCGRMKCCLNFELDAYLEALNEFPENEHAKIDFADGTYRPVKTDILKRLMWFVKEDEIGGDWRSFSVEEVKNYRQMNTEGKKPELIPIVKEEKKQALDFKNDMGTESLTRLDDRKSPRKNKNKNRNRNKNKKGDKGKS
jgi:cell fate regulator YaaT (PSP1 superfamily)